MIDLYALTSPNVQKIYVMLEECGLLYKEHFVDVWKGEQYKPEFSKINPNNKIPAIVDHEGPGGKPFTVIESGAILMYLAEKSGKFLPKDMAKRYEVLQWLLIQLTGVGPMFGQWTHFKLFAPKGSKTFNSQTTFVLPVAGTQGTTYMFMGDRWIPTSLGTSPYIWLPLTVKGTSVSLAWHAHWTIDAVTGLWHA